MNIRTGIWVDHIVGTSLCWMLDWMTFCVGLMLRRDHKPPFPARRILVIKLIGIGSIVQALPMLEALSRRYPEAEVRMLCFPETEVLSKRIKSVSHVHLIENRSIFKLGWTSLRALGKIIAWRPDLVLDLEYHSKFSSILATLTCALNRIGFFDVSTRFRKYLYTHLIFANPQRHINDVFNQIAKVVGARDFKSLEDCSAQIVIQERERQECDRALAEAGIAASAPLIAINVNAGELCFNRRWPAEQFAALMAALVEHNTVVLVGSPGERQYVESVRSQIADPEARAKVHNFAGKVSFGGFLELLRRSSLVITNDTGPMHLAAALGARVISLWGPGTPLTYQPRSSKHVAVWKGIFCSPCLYVTSEPPCVDNNICMQRITLEDVIQVINKLTPAIRVESDHAMAPCENKEDQWLQGLVLRRHQKLGN